MFKMPDFLQYPTIKDISDTPELKGVFSYIIHGYTPKYGILISRQKSDDGFGVGVHIDGFNAQIDKKRKEQLLATTAKTLIATMGVIGVQQAEFYFDDTDALIDMQISINKFIGPGMLRDLFSKSVMTQRIIEIGVVDDEKIKQIKTDRSKYPKHVIIKPSRFRLASNSLLPAYASIKQN